MPRKVETNWNISHKLGGRLERGSVVFKNKHQNKEWVERCFPAEMTVLSKYTISRWERFTEMLCCLGNHLFFQVFLSIWKSSYCLPEIHVHLDMAYLGMKVCQTTHCNENILCQSWQLGLFLALKKNCILCCGLWFSWKLKVCLCKEIVATCISGLSF